MTLLGLRLGNVQYGAAHETDIFVRQETAIEAKAAPFLLLLILLSGWSVLQSDVRLFGRNTSE